MGARGRGGTGAWGAGVGMPFAPLLRYSVAPSPPRPRAPTLQMCGFYYYQRLIFGLTWTGTIELNQRKAIVELDR